MNVNRIFLAGNLTRDPELKYLPSQMAVADFGMAINREWKDKGGEKKSEVCFVDCVAFGRIAENINKYVKKGDPFFVEGRLQFSQWETEGGQKRSKLKALVENFQFLGSPKQSEPEQNNPAPNKDVDF